MKRYRFWVAGMLLLFVTGNVWAQKTKIKGEPSNVSNDSLKAEMEKAAQRASMLMQNSRDSIQSADMQPPSSVVDTFAVAPKGDPAYTFVKASQFADARKRIAAAEADLARAAKALASASQSGTADEQALEASAERIRQQTENLAKISAKLDAVEAEWKKSHHPVDPNAKPTAPAKTPPATTAPNSPILPKGTPVPTTPSPKGGMTKGTTTTNVSAPTPATDPKPNPKKLK